MLGKLFGLMRAGDKAEAVEQCVDECAQSEGTVARSLRHRLSSIDGALSLSQGRKTIDVGRMSLSEVVGTLIALRLSLAGERQGLSALPEGKDLTRFVGLSACALAAVAGARAALEKLEPTAAIDPEKMREAALAPTLVRIAVLGDEWRHEFSGLLKMASKQLFADDQSSHEKVESFRQLVMTLGIGEMRAFDIGSAADQQQDQVATGITKALFSMVR